MKMLATRLGLSPVPTAIPTMKVSRGHPKPLGRMSRVARLALADKDSRTRSIGGEPWWVIQSANIRRRA